MQNVTSVSRPNREHFALILRLRQSRSSPPPDSALRLRALALVRDVLRSRLDADVTENAQEWVHCEGFADLGRALAASRALQFAFEGFRSVAPAERSSICMVLDSSGPEETAAAAGGPSVEQKDLLGAAKPAQVLITQAFYDRIAPYQPALRSSPLRAGVYEFLWTSEQRLAELQAEAEWMPTLVTEVVEPRALDETAIYQTIQPSTRTRWKDPEPAPVAPEPEPVFEEAEAAPRRSLNPIVAIGTAIAMLMMIGYLVYTFAFSGNHAKQPASSPVSQPAIPDKPPTVTPPPAKAETATPPETPPPTPTPQNPPAVVTDARPSSPPAPRPARGCSIAGEVPDFLRLADSYRSRGDYERAITNYNLVLGCEPGNRQAITGKRNAETAEKYASQ